ncbi:hypothetical protein ACOSQ2_010408 [Xanthoceras sorbifolium]
MYPQVIILKQIRMNITSKNKTSRAQQDLFYKTGRTHFLKVKNQYEFDKHLRDIPEEEQTNAIREQVFTQVMGSDDHDHVHLFGTGTTSSNGVGQNLTVDEIRVKLDKL